MAKRIRKRKGRQVASVPMAPMIDMVFLLLVFFMTAGAMSQAGSKLELDLPEAPSSQISKELSGRLIVSIDEGGQVHMGGIALDDNEFEERLAEAKESNPRIKLRIRAAKATEFEYVKNVMRQAASAGIDSYLYATYQTGE